jgi:hypothetical protein
VIIRDKDEKGKRHAQLVATRLHGNAGSVRVIELPEKDSALFFERGGTVKELLALSDNAPQWIPEINNFPLLQECNFFLNGHMPPLPRELVRHILHQGEKMVIGGTSKARKSMTLIDLAISIVTGSDWWGFRTFKSKVCYINFEIQDAFFWFRVNEICSARRIKTDPNMFYALNLRGFAEQIDHLRGKLLSILKPMHFGFICIDPIYKALGGRDENKAGDVAAMLNEIERLAVETKAAIAFGAHYSKGNQAAKESIDRIGGSGVFARDPDSILTMTAHEELECLSVEPTLRNFPPIAPFVVRWEWPVFVRDENLNPDELRKPGPRGQFNDKMLLDELSVVNGIPIKKLKSLMDELHEMSKSEFYRRYKRLVIEKRIILRGQELFRSLRNDVE